MTHDRRPPSSAPDFAPAPPPAGAGHRRARVRPPHAEAPAATDAPSVAPLAPVAPVAPARTRAPGRSRAGHAVRTAAPSGAPHEPRLAHVAALVADATRARMLAYLLSGEYASAGELARAASVSAATASAHLARLVESGLLACEPRGRHRYFRLADADVAHALEALAMVAERSTHERSWSAPARMRLREARCCYGHLAGRRGVALLQRMLGRGWLALAPDGYALTPAGAAGLADLGLDAAAWLEAPARQRVAYPCLDWSERRDHLAGPLAASLLSHFVARGWLRREPGERALALTPPGKLALAALVELEDETPVAG